jgi:hypothetical protein
MQYKHNPPTLAEIRQMRREAKILMESNNEKGGIFSGKGVDEDSHVMEELLIHQLDVIVAHLENQNELILQLARKIDKK